MEYDSIDYSDVTMTNRAGSIRASKIPIRAPEFFIKLPTGEKFPLEQNGLDFFKK